MRGAISHTAESVYQKLSAAEKTIARNIFLRLTELGEGTEDTRRRASFDELMSHHENAEDVGRVLNQLAEARLITLSENNAEVAHEALIREWPTLREWLNQDHEGLRLHRNITEATQEWELLEHDPDTLYRGARLSQAREWAALHPNALNTGEKAFLDASNDLEQHEQAEREAQQKRELEAAQKLAETERMRAEDQAHSVKRLRQRGVFLASALALALVAAIIAGVFASNAQQQSLIASVRELSSEANLNLDIDPERSTLLALQAVNKTYAIDKTVLPEAEDALHRAIQSSRLEMTLGDNADAVWSAVFSPDGTRIATGSADGIVKVLDAITGKELLAIQSSTEGGVGNVEFSPSGKLLAAAGDDNIARIWDATTGQELLALKGHLSYVQYVAFSSDGTRLATGSADATAKI